LWSGFVVIGFLTPGFGHYPLSPALGLSCVIPGILDITSLLPLAVTILIVNQKQQQQQKIKKSSNKIHGRI
jgi:hypothetical protein